MKLTWRAEEVTRELYRDVGQAVAEIGLEMERGAKTFLFPGHGYDTGSLQRSIHVARPGHRFAHEHRYPDGPERGGKLIIVPTIPVPAIELGTGQRYAPYVLRYINFFDAALIRARAMAGPILRKYRR